MTVPQIVEAVNNRDCDLRGGSFFQEKVSRPGAPVGTRSERVLIL
jgi:hypothetical protein